MPVIADQDDRMRLVPEPQREWPMASNPRERCPCGKLFVHVWAVAPGLVPVPNLPPDRPCEYLLCSCGNCGLMFRVGYEAAMVVPDEEVA